MENLAVDFTIHIDNQKRNPKVSVGLPVYNGEKTLARALDSLLAQDYENFEVLISDNCSTDKTAAIAMNYCNLDPRFRYFRQSINRGSIQNFNEVFKLSDGEFFFWASHDDFRTTNFISTCLDILLQDSTAVLCSPRIEFKIPSETEVIWIGDLHTFQLKKRLVSRFSETLTNFPAAAIYGLFRSSAIKQTELFKDCIASDLIFIQNLSMYGTFTHTNESVFTYVGREVWNSLEQDYATFYGNKKMPRFFSPFFVVFANQVNVIFNSATLNRHKFLLLAILIRYQFLMLMKKVLLKLLKLVGHVGLRKRLANAIYWRFFHCENVFVTHSEVYVNRIIYPIMGIPSR
jgi:glycosyltransferase involved in cell wall biosynthesis